MSSRSYKKVQEDLLAQLKELPKNQRDELMGKVAQIKDPADSFYESDEFANLCAEFEELEGVSEKFTLEVKATVEVDVYAAYGDLECDVIDYDLDYNEMCNSKEYKAIEKSYMNDFAKFEKKIERLAKKHNIDPTDLRDKIFGW